MRHHIVDTFADTQRAGNPAAVIQAPEFPSGTEMQQTAHRIGLPTTAFVVPTRAGEYRVRWFTPYKEINLCGHATVASARVLFSDSDETRLTFVSANGVLHAERLEDLIAIDLPTSSLTDCAPPPGLLDALGTDAVSCAVSGDDVLIEVESPTAVGSLCPDFAALAAQPFRGHIVTARGDDGVDFVSRTFFPALGVNEDQVCVTAHCKLIPYWARRLGKERLTAVQLSERGGRLELRDSGERIQVLGTAILRDGVYDDRAPQLERMTR